jgi:allantoate deiminase
MREVHTALAPWMTQSGMTVRVDAVGNIHGFYPSALSSTPAAEAPRLYVGSHLDTVPNAGAFDGVLGVVLGIALVELLGGNPFPFAIEVVGFTDEEGVRFATPFLGSHALAGTFDKAFLDRVDRAGRSLRDAIREFGLDPGRIPDAQAPPQAFAYLEFHIEQGPVLDNLNLPLAVVDCISGQSRSELTFTGMAAHAGTTPMKLRRDALACAAVWISEVERQARETEGLVATVGRIAVEPGAGNVVPGSATVSLDVRHPIDSERRAAVARLAEAAQQLASERGLRVVTDSMLDQSSVVMDEALASTLQGAIEQMGIRPHRMPSGAGHDAMVMASRMPAAMLFLRCLEGVSHNPAEKVREEDAAAALEVGLRFLHDCSQRPRA